MIRADIYPQHARNIVDEEDDELQPPPVVLDVRLTWEVPRLPAELEYPMPALIVQLDDSYTPLVDNLIAATHALRAGSISISEADIHKQDIGVAFRAHKCEILRFAHRPPAESCTRFVQGVFAEKYGAVVVLDALPRAMHISEGAGSALPVRVLATSCVPGELLDVLSGISQLEIGNVVSGIAAAIICYAEARGTHAIATVVIREAFRSPEIVQSVNSVKPLLSHLVGVDIHTPDMADIRIFVRRDPFVHDTANLYT